MNLSSTTRTCFTVFVSLLLAVAAAGELAADVISARAQMEDIANPLVHISSSRGNIYIELYPTEAPTNVAHILDLVSGNWSAAENQGNGAQPQSGYYNGMRFHRVIPDFLIQTGSPFRHPLGASSKVLRDEINAEELGLDTMPLMSPAGNFHPQLAINNKNDFEREILIPLYQRMGLDSAEDVQEKQQEIAEQLQQLSVLDIYTSQGYRYTSAHPSRVISSGSVALANSGPDSNGSEFFINLHETGFGLTGKYTVIGQVVEGMEVVRSINTQEIDPRYPSNSAVSIFTITITQ